MATNDPRIDAYIDDSAEFAKPILRHLRDVVHQACPDVQEDIKWRFPHFLRQGRIVCSMAAFKEHCAFTFWTGELVLGDAAKDGGMGQFGRITSLKDLPSKKVLSDYVKKAATLRAEGAVRARSGKKPRAPLPEPHDLAAALALAENAKARATWEGFPPSHRREYVEWITEAKRDATRAKRVDRTLEWLSEGKARNWKYER